MAKSAPRRKLVAGHPTGIGTVEADVAAEAQPLLFRLHGDEQLDRVQMRV